MWVVNSCFLRNLPTAFHSNFTDSQSHQRDNTHFYWLFLPLSLTFSSPHSCFLVFSLKLSAPSSTQALLSREQKLRQWPHLFPVQRARDSHQGEVASSTQENGSMWLLVIVVLETRACTRPRARTRSQVGHESYRLNSGVETIPHKKPEMRAPRNWHSALVRESHVCSPMAAQPYGPFPRLWPATALCQSGSDTAWPFLGPSKPFPTFSPK